MFVFFIVLFYTRFHVTDRQVSKVQHAPQEVKQSFWDARLELVSQLLVCSLLATTKTGRMCNVIRPEDIETAWESRMKSLKDSPNAYLTVAVGKPPTP